MNLKEFLNKTSDIKGYVLASLTDEYIVDTWPMKKSSFVGKEDKVLEIHVFNENQEERLIRTDISKEFAYHQAIDNGKEYFDECQYIDIDTLKLSEAKEGEVVTTGGGTFNLPIDKKAGARLKLRYYFDKYEETGHVKLADWRMVDFVTSERAGD